jgi:drug/metabolite transporter superfamily protein YnfA
MNSALVSTLVLFVAAVFEVAGDAVIRRGMRGAGLAFIVLGFLMLGTYGIVVNRLGWDFSQLLGAYVAVFALVAVAAGRLVFAETVAPTTWAGLVVILAGGAIIQFGPALFRAG